MLRNDPEGFGPLAVRGEHPLDRMSAGAAAYVRHVGILAHVCLMNELADLCEAAGADVEAVRAWLAPCGWLWVPLVSAYVAGPSLPQVAISWCEHLAEAGTPYALSLAVATAHQARRPLLLRQVRTVLGDDLGKSTVAVWGLSFQANTDDCSDSVALHLINVMRRQHPAMRFRVYDPAAMPRARRYFGLPPSIHFASDVYDAADSADLLVIATEWEVFAKADLARVAVLLQNPVIVDGRNLFAPASMRAFGFEYRSLGRPVVERGVPLRNGSSVSQEIARRALSAFSLLIEAFLKEVRAFCERQGAEFHAVLGGTAREPRLRHLTGSPPATAAMRDDAAWLRELARAHRVPLHIMPVLG